MCLCLSVFFFIIIIITAATAENCTTVLFVMGCWWFNLQCIDFVLKDGCIWEEVETEPN
jgi:hypothetical protein